MSESLMTTMTISDLSTASTSIPPAIELAALHNDPVEPSLRATAREIIKREEAELGIGKPTNTVFAAWNFFGSWTSPDTTGTSLRLERCRNVVSPIRNVPNEVLGEIFAHCAESQPITLWHLPDDPTKTAPWSLTWVCKRWRAVALAQSALWTRIHALAFTSGVGRTRSKLLRNGRGDRRMDLVLSRSGVGLLDVAISWLDGWGSTEIPVLLCATAARLRTLEFRAAPTFDQVNADSRLGPFLDFLSREQENLTFSHLEEAHLQFGAAPIDGIRVFRNATNLRKLILTSNFLFQSLCLSSLHDQLPLGRLRYLKVADRRLPTEVLYQIICHSPSLEFLGVTISSLSTSWIDPSTLPSTHALPDLSELSIIILGDMLSVNNMLWWLERLHLPKLRAFRLGTESAGGTRPVWDCPDPQLQAIAASHVLERLTLDVNLYVHDMLRLLQSLPNISDLKLRNVCPAPSILRHLASRELLPALTTLSCGMHRSRFDDHLEMIMQRARRDSSDGCSTLNQVELVVFPIESSDTQFMMDEPGVYRSMNLLNKLGWKIRFNPGGWQEKVMSHTSQAVALIILYRT